MPKAYSKMQLFVALTLLVIPVNIGMVMGDSTGSVVRITDEPEIIEDVIEEDLPEEDYGEVVQEVIQDGSSESASKAFDGLLPDIVKGTTPGIVEDLDTKSSEQLAEESLGTIFDIVEVSVLQDGVDFIFDNFAGRIFQLITNGFGGVVERTAEEVLISNQTDN